MLERRDLAEETDDRPGGQRECVAAFVALSEGGGAFAGDGRGVHDVLRGEDAFGREAEPGEVVPGQPAVCDERVSAEGEAASDGKTER